MENWPRLIALREEVLKALEVARAGEIHRRIAGSPRASWWSRRDLQPLVEEYRDFLRYLFIVSQVEITRQAVEGATATGLAGLSVKIEKALGRKCDRCWNYSEQVGKDERYPTVCERCSAALKEIEAGR